MTKAKAAAPTEAEAPQDEVGESPAEVGESPTTEEGHPEPGFALFIYEGDADVAEYGGFRFRPGQPVAVPSKKVEGLLTTIDRSERFTIVKE